MDEFAADEVTEEEAAALESALKQVKQVHRESAQRNPGPSADQGLGSCVAGSDG
jgi:hypothetical protein